MKAFFALVCLIVVAVAQNEPEVNCDVSSNEEGWAVLLPNPVDCGSYYVCNDGLPVLMPCPEGLHFNPRNSTCDWPVSAKCEESEIGSF